MGYNTSIVVMNDALGSIADDKDFGLNLSKAVQKVACYGKAEDVHAGGHCNAASVIESHHADALVPVLVGGNYGIVVDSIALGWSSNSPELDLLKRLALKHGYGLRKK